METPAGVIQPTGQGQHSVRGFLLHEEWQIERLRVGGGGVVCVCIWGGWMLGCFGAGVCLVGVPVLFMIFCGG